MTTVLAAAPETETLASVARSKKCSVNAIKEFRFPNDRPCYEVLAGFEVDGTPSAIRDTIAAIEARFMVPTDWKEAAALIGELMLITRVPNDDLDTRKRRVTAYAERLARYPADVARKAVLEHSWTFFPSWAELRDVCDRLCGERRQLLDALRLKLCG